MKACAFDYARPKQVSEAANLLRNDNAKALAGGQSLGPMLNLRVLQPGLLVDLRHLEELKAASEEKDSLVIGACVTHAQIEDGKVPDATRGFMRKVAGNIAYRAVRNRGTVGGSLVHADPAADWPSALMALGAAAIVAGPNGRREVPLEQFIRGIFEVDLAQEELLVGIRVPKPSPSARFGYWKFCRKAGEFPQAIGAVLHDPERGVSRAVAGALAGAPSLFTSKNVLEEKSFRLEIEDAYNRQLHEVALRRACRIALEAR